MIKKILFQGVWM